MTKISERTEQVYREGKMRRGQFTPKGAPKKIYQYWAKNTKHPRGMENFCHFWRVVVFWAPLMKVRKTLAAMAEKPRTWVGIAILYTLVMATLGVTVAPDWLLGIAIPYTIFGVILGSIAGVYGMENLKEEDDIDIKPVFYVLGLVSLPTFAISHYLAKISKAVWNTIGNIALIVLAVAALGIIVAAIIKGFLSDFWLALEIAGGVLGVVILIFFAAVGIAKISQHFTNKRKQAYADALYLYYEGKGPDPDLPKPRPERKPAGKIETIIVNILSTVWDFVVLAFNVVRVNKWKICPIVEIDDK